MIASAKGDYGSDQEVLPAVIERTESQLYSDESSLLQASQKRHQVCFLLGSEAQVEALVVEFNRVVERWRCAVMEIRCSGRKSAQHRAFNLSFNLSHICASS